ncbi:hypothetical protein GKQ77_18245 [Streptomyces sp. BG9H]|uniref:Uncharacterized protein n=1 Tax=Streptomyces anatolicus TaxID=2675858 RepID=A0ABS6YPX3_9ACTN|nr:hypothetical protein [Streptomyces anatolicus]MBW5423484.1 hypothetical protein [Streptomyces anatolicus]
MRETQRAAERQTTAQDAAGRGPACRTGLAALQQRAGNAAVTHWLQRQTGDLKEPYATRPTEHPEWGPYQELTEAAGIPQSQADAAWQLLLGGVDSQGALNAEALAKTNVRQEQRDLRASNTWYQEFVRLMTEHLEIRTPTMALWSGGIETSDYAYGKGHTPLERTRIGGVLNVLKLHPDWKLKTPMWNVLSKAFVARATGPVHIFMRAYAPESVLISQEIPQLRLVQELNPDVKLVWHPVYTTPDGRLREITADYQLVDNAEYGGRDICVSVLIQYLRKFHDESNAKATPAHENMEKLIVANGHKEGA